MLEETFQRSTNVLPVLFEINEFLLGDEWLKEYISRYPYLSEDEFSRVS